MPLIELSFLWIRLRYGFDMKGSRMALRPCAAAGQPCSSFTERTIGERLSPAPYAFEMPILNIPI